MTETTTIDTSNRQAEQNAEDGTAPTPAAKPAKTKPVQAAAPDCQPSETSAAPAPTPGPGSDLDLDPLGDDFDEMLEGLRDLVTETRKYAHHEDEPRIRSLYVRDAANLTRAYGQSLLLRGKHRKAVREER